MIHNVKIFFSLIRLGIGTVDASDKECASLTELSMKEWRSVMRLAEKQGVAAIAIDGMQRLYDTYGKEIKTVADDRLEWTQWVLENAMILTQYEQMCLMQRTVIRDVSEIWAKEGVKMMVFKGQANASLYPKPLHRSTDDIDCFLFGDAKKGDSLLKDEGAFVDTKWYRHSKILYKKETIENHLFFTHIRGRRKNRKMDESSVK